MDFGPGGGTWRARAVADRRGGGPPPRLLVERLASELDLTADQRTKIEEVLTARRSRVETLQREVRERFEAEQRSLRDEIPQGAHARATAEVRQEREGARPLRTARPAALDSNRLRPPVRVDAHWPGRSLRPPTRSASRLPSAKGCPWTTSRRSSRFSTNTPKSKRPGFDTHRLPGLRFLHARRSGWCTRRREVGGPCGVPQGQAFLRTVGHESTRVVSLTETRLDEHDVLARVQFVWRFAQASASPIDVPVDSTFVLFVDQGALRIVFQQEREDFQQALRARGVLPPKAQAPLDFI